MIMLNIELIQERLSTKYIAKKINYTQSTESTNDDCRKAAENQEKEGAVFISEEQTRGRGRMLRQWVTRPGDSIALSILLRPSILPSKAPTITPVLALAAVESLREITTLDIRIKWPNDIFLENKKIGGILTEMSAGMNEVKYIIAGLGLNINQEVMDEEIKDIATSLRIYSGEAFDREIIIAELLNKFEEYYESFIKYGLSYFEKSLRKYSAILGKEVIVISGLEMLEGYAEDLDETGNLLLRLPDGRIKTILYGDVSLKYKELLKP